MTQNQLDIPCYNCGAKIGPTAPGCPYCGATTAHGQQLEQAAVAQSAHHLQAQRQLKLTQQMERDRQRKQAMESAATFALISGLLGFVTCCLPLGPVLGIIMGLKARRLARETGFARPMRGTVGLVCGVIGLLGAAAGWAWFISDQITKDQDIEALKAATADLAEERELSEEGACKLVQLELLEGSSYTIYRASKVKCKGGLKRDGERAVLSDVRILKTKVITVKGCLAWNGKIWVVKKTPRRGDCWPKAEEESEEESGEEGADAGAKKASGEAGAE